MKKYLFILLALVFSASPMVAAAEMNNHPELRAALMRLHQALEARRGLETPPGWTKVVSPGQACQEFKANLRPGDRGPEVMRLKMFLKQEGLLAEEAGEVFDEATAKGVRGFQEKYGAEVLKAAGLTSGTNFFGPLSRLKANQLQLKGCGLGRPWWVSSTTPPVFDPATTTSTTPLPPHANAGSLRVLTPNGGESLELGQNTTITWERIHPYQMMVDANGMMQKKYLEGGNAVGIRLLTGAGVAPQIIAIAAPNTGSYTWRAGEIWPGNLSATRRLVPAGRYLVEVCQGTERYQSCDKSDAAFALTGTATSTATTTTSY